MCVRVCTCAHMHECLKMYVHGFMTIQKCGICVCNYFLTFTEMQ